MAHLLAQLISIRNFLGNLYIADFFDVFIIAILIYFVIYLFKQTRSFYIAAGIGIIIALYPIAQIFGLFLTSMVFQAFWSVFFIALVVIFQEELRRFFEHLAMWSTRQIKRGKEVTRPAVVKEILSAVGQMARDKIGALIVIQGHDLLEKFISGGKLLDGVISEELLLSIFDPTSIGHDGALIVKGNRVSAFGTHLPLSTDFAQIGKRGTRHSAALGLAEVSDVFVIVVSEERGEISYAHKGRLTTLKSIDEISEPLNKFFSSIYPAQTYSTFDNIIKRNSLAKLLALTLAIVFWFFFSFKAATTQRDFTVPITYKNIADNMLIEDTKPKEVTVTLAVRGTNAFDALDAQTLSISIDVSRLTTGPQKITITEDEVIAPPNFSVINIKPPEITVTVKPVKTISMNIFPDISGRIPAGFEISKVTVNPATVATLVPDSFKGAATLTTELIYISGSRSTSTKTKTIVPNGIRLKNSSDLVVNVSVEIKRR